MDVNEIKAGKYVLLAARWDEPTSKPGEPFTFLRHRRGDELDLDEAEARRLYASGAVAKPGELEKRAAEAAARQLQAALDAAPAHVREGILANFQATPGAPVVVAEEPSTPAARTSAAKK